jgi:hypothetical protein
MDIEVRRSSLLSTAKRYSDAGFSFPDDDTRHRAKVGIRLNISEYVTDNDTRRRLLGWLWVGRKCELSTTDLTDAQVKAIKDWLCILPTGAGGQFTISEIAAGELRQMAEMINYAPGQLALPPLVQEAIAMGGQVKMIDDKGQDDKAQSDYFQFE